MGKSYEEDAEDALKKELDRLHIKHYSKTDTINSAIEQALKSAPSKSGGAETIILM